MKSRHLTASVALGCALLGACVPYDETKGKKTTPPGKPTDQNISSAEQQKLQQQRDELKKKEEEEKKKEELANKPAEGAGTNENPTPNPPAADPKDKKDWAFAQKVPGKEGFVFSPYNNKIVDVRDIPSGTLVQDPTYTGAGKGYFRVP